MLISPDGGTEFVGEDERFGVGHFRFAEIFGPKVESHRYQFASFWDSIEIAGGQHELCGLPWVYRVARTAHSTAERAEHFAAFSDDIRKRHFGAETSIIDRVRRSVVGEESEVWAFVADRTMETGVSHV